MATTAAGDRYVAGSFETAMTLTTEDSHNVYISRNGQLLGWIDVKDEVRPEAISIVQYLASQGYTHHSFKWRPVEQMPSAGQPVGHR